MASHEDRINQSKVIFQANLVVGYWELIPMESEDQLLTPHNTATVRVTEERTEAKKQRNNFWTEEKWPKMKKTLVNSWHPAVIGQCDESCLELRFDPVTKQTVFNVLQRIGRKLIAYKNAFTMKERALLS